MEHKQNRSKERAATDVASLFQDAQYPWWSIVTATYCNVLAWQTLFTEGQESSFKVTKLDTALWETKTYLRPKEVLPRFIWQTSVQYRAVMR